jgi:uncharacterized protein
MKKKLLVFITTLALLISIAIPAFAGTYGYGVSASDASSAVIAKSIYDTYGIEAYYVVDNEISDEGGARSLANSSYSSIAKSENVIIYSTTSTEYGVFAWGTGEYYKQFIDSSSVYQNLKEYDSAGQDEQAAISFLNDINLAIGSNYDASAAAAYQGSSSDSGSTTGNPYNTPVSDGSRVVDAANLLTDEEEAALVAKLDEISERQQFDVVVVTASTIDGKSPMAYADDFYDYNGYGFGANNDGCLLLVSMEDRDWWISTTGYGITALTDAGIEYIGDEFVSYLSDAEYAKGFDMFADLVDKFVTQAKEGNPYDVGNMPRATKTAQETAKGVLICFGIALVAALIAMFKVKSDYKPVKFKSSASDYLVNGSFALTGQYDNFVTTSVSKTRRESSSSGGSSTHSGSSGTSHGGGGGKF